MNKLKDWLVKCRQCKHCYQVKADADEVRCRLKDCRYESPDKAKVQQKVRIRNNEEINV